VKTLLKILGGLLLLIVALVATVVLSLRASPPAQTYALKPAPPADPAVRPVLVFGASGASGVEIVRLLRAAGRPVTAAVRPSSDRGELEALGATFVVVDALDATATAGAVAGTRYEAVISTIGCLGCEPKPDFIANKNVIDAAAASGVRRLLLVTSIGVGDSAAAAPLVSRLALSPVLPLKGQAEDHLRASGLDYTIIRPGGLRPPTKAPTGQGYLSEDPTAFGFIHRADLARLVVGALDDPGTIGRTYSAADPSLATPWQ
jgi:uncharacterized protein YbjT (DUF2867 family)